MGQAWLKEPLTVTRIRDNIGHHDARNLSSRATKILKGGEDLNKKRNISC